MRSLKESEIEKLASRKNVKKMAVENFLMSMGDNSGAAYENLRADARSYKWNTATQNAISAGIKLASQF